MKILKELKQVSIAILPLVLVVVFVDLFAFDVGNLWQFLIGAAMLIVGETLVLVSADESVVRMGAMVAYSSRRKNGFLMVLAFALIFGILSTLAEPDMQVLAGEISILGLKIPQFVFVLAAGVGVGICCCLGLARSNFKFPIWIVMLVLYATVLKKVEFVGKSLKTLSSF